MLGAGILLWPFSRHHRDFQMSGVRVLISPPRRNPDCPSHLLVCVYPQP